MCGYFCIAFINFMLARKTSTDFTNLFSPNNFKTNDVTYFVSFGVEHVPEEIKTFIVNVKLFYG